MKFAKRHQDSYFIYAFFLIVGLLSLIFVFSSCGNDEVAAATPAKIPEKKAPTVRFGIVVDSLDVVDGEIERNQVLSEILEPYNIDNPTLFRLADKARPIYSVRNLAAGKPYTILCSNDSLHTAQYFVYQPNAIDYVVYDLRDTLSVFKGQRPVTTKTLSSAGKINGSLYETLEKQNADPALAMKLAAIYGWSVDFYRIKRGDWFKIIYDQRYVKGQPVEAGEIKAAVFCHEGDTIQAFYFQPDSTEKGEYYTESGNSLRKAFLKAPLKYSRISSRFTMRRFHPVQKRWKAHLGTDYAAPTGTPIISTGSGTVIASQYSKFNGNFVKIKHNNTYTTQYLHMSRRAVKTGQHIQQGQVIGYVGSTGLATGPHVCYRFWKNGKQVDPYAQHFPPATPVAKEYRAAFDSLVSQEAATLSALTAEE